jgi:hypothetical protein
LLQQVFDEITGGAALLEELGGNLSWFLPGHAA